MEKNKIRDGIYAENLSVKNEIINDVLTIRCPICVNGYPKKIPLKLQKNMNPKLTFKNNDELLNHVRKYHELNLCPTCLKYRKVFSIEQIAFTERQLDRHLSGIRETEEETKNGIPPHKKCPICKYYLFSESDYNDHGDQYHIPCAICNSRGLHFYFNNKYNLDSHCKTNHFPCDFPGCIGVFDNMYQLKLHKKRDHGDKHATILNVFFLLIFRSMIFILHLQIDLMILIIIHH